MTTEAQHQAGWGHRTRRKAERCFYWDQRSPCSPDRDREFPHACVKHADSVRGMRADEPPPSTGQPVWQPERINRDYVTDDDLDREALARHNARVLLENGVEPAEVAELVPTALTCHVCGAPRRRDRKTCGRRACIVRARTSFPRTPAVRAKIAAGVSASRTPGVRAKIGAASRRHWADSEYRARLSAALSAAAKSRASA